MNPPEPQELLGPRLTKGEPTRWRTRPNATTAPPDATSHASPPDLRRLQDGEAHLTHGFASFGAYAEHTFDGLSAATAPSRHSHRRG
jgi:hypothetical protein